MTEPVGLKYDAGKAPWSLLMRGCGKALAGVVAVLQFGARKYAPDSWQHVENGQNRYRDALYRHMHEIEVNGHQAVDPETGLLHWSHVACNALFLAHLAAEKLDPLDAIRAAGHDNDEQSKHLLKAYRTRTAAEFQRESGGE